GLKFPSELSVKGSDRIDTDSTARARVVPAVLIKTGLGWVAADVAWKAPHRKTATPAHTTLRKCRRKQEARFFIRGRSLVTTDYLSTMRLANFRWWRGHRATATLVQSNI